MNEVLAKISTLQEDGLKRLEPLETVSNVQPAAVQQNGADAEKYQKKLDELEAQLTGVTRQRLDYLEKLQQQHLEIQVTYVQFCFDLQVWPGM